MILVPITAEPRAATSTGHVAKIRELSSEGLMKTEIAKRLGVGRATVYRALGD